MSDGSPEHSAKSLTTSIVLLPFADVTVQFVNSSTVEVMEGSSPELCVELVGMAEVVVALLIHSSDTAQQGVYAAISADFKPGLAMTRCVHSH